MGKDFKKKELGKGISQRVDGRYQARFTNRYGKRVTYYSRNLQEVREWLTTEKAKDRLSMNVVDNSLTLQQWFLKWMDVYKYGIIRESTKRQYIQIYSKQIEGTLGNRKLNEITHLQIKGLINDLDRRGYKFETKNKVRILLSDMFDKAMIDNFVMKNPAKGIKIERDEEVEPKFLTLEEQKLFFDYSKGTFYDNMFVVSVNSGLRPGEVYALRECDLDFEKKIIFVKRTLMYAKYEGDESKTFHLGPPKTKASIRKVPMTRACETALKKQILQSRLIKSRSSKVVEEQFQDLLFTTKFGTPINSQIECDAIKVIVDGINLIRDDLEQLECFGGHTFRHTFASNCYHNGFSWKAIQKLLGHAKLSHTTDLYVHLFAEEIEEDMEVLSEAMEKLDNLDMAEIVDDKYNKHIQEEKEKQKNIIQFASNY